MTKVLVVDDSALMRKYLRSILEAVPGFEVTTARNGLDALDAVRAEEPDVVTLDINMPEMDGLTCLGELMREHPRPVVMLSSLTERGSLATLEALELGAVDYVAKPGGTVSLNLDLVAEEIVDKVRAAARARVRVGGLAERVRRTRDRGAADRAGRRRSVSAGAPTSAVELVLVGSSTGGPAALPAVLAPIPSSFPAPIVIAQHIPASFTAHLAARLDGVCRLDVVELARQAELLPGTVYVARGDADVVVSRQGGRLVGRSVPASPAHRWHPSVDRLVATALEVVDAGSLVGVLLTGMGDDGAAAMAALHRRGGRTIAEAESTCVVYGMPGELVRAGGATKVLPVDRIADHVVGWV